LAQIAVRAFEYTATIMPASTSVHYRATMSIGRLKQGRRVC
jgi:hypothetical protein